MVLWEKEFEKSCLLTICMQKKFLSKILYFSNELQYESLSFYQKNAFNSCTEYSTVRNHQYIIIAETASQMQIEVLLLIELLHSFHPVGVIPQNLTSRSGNHYVDCICNIWYTFTDVLRVVSRIHENNNNI